MKIIKFILLAAIMMCSILSCQAQDKKKVTDKTFQTFLDKFTTVSIPINHKKANIFCKDMTEKEAIQFLDKKASDLITVRQVLGVDDNDNEVIEDEKEINLPCCDFKYSLNDSILILGTREGILGGEKDTALVYLNSFSLQGALIDRCVVGGSIYYYESPVFENNFDFVLFAKNKVKVFYYDENNSKIEDGFLSTVYYVDYEITQEGTFVKKEKSDITYLKLHADSYFRYNSQNEDDPMNKYDY